MTAKADNHGHDYDTKKKLFCRPSTHLHLLHLVQRPNLEGNTGLKPQALKWVERDIKTFRRQPFQPHHFQ